MHSGKAVCSVRVKSASSCRAVECRSTNGKETSGKGDVTYLQINHEFNESLAVMHFVHGYGPYGKGRGKLQRLARHILSGNVCCQRLMPSEGRATRPGGHTRMRCSGGKEVVYFSLRLRGQQTRVDNTEVPR